MMWLVACPRRAPAPVCQLMPSTETWGTPAVVDLHCIPAERHKKCNGDAGSPSPVKHGAFTCWFNLHSLPGSCSSTDQS